MVSGNGQSEKREAQDRESGKLEQTARGFAVGGVLLAGEGFLVIELAEGLVRGPEDSVFRWRGVVIGAHLLMLRAGGIKMLLGRG